MPARRVLVHDPWDRERPKADALVDQIGHLLGEGRAITARRPAHDRMEFVLAAHRAAAAPGNSAEAAAARIDQATDLLPAEPTRGR